MPSRRRVAMTISLQPETAREYERIAEDRGETKSRLFREMFDLYKKERLEEEFFRLQRYGAKGAGRLKLTQKEIERLVLEGR